MNKTRLYDKHVALGGRMIEFAGWMLPVQYPTGPLAEHHAVRTAAGLFDIDHMGQFMVRGPDALPYLQRVMTWDVSTLQPDDAHYSLMCYEDGTVVDDVFIYRRDDDYMVVVNAANRKKDLRWMVQQARGFEVTITDVSDETYMLALQGPKAEAILQKLTDIDLSAVPRFTSKAGIVAGIFTLIGRTGYTGEDGFELFFSADQAERMWDAILDAGKEDGLLPCGLAARDSLRFEACFPLYGHEIHAEIDPISARLGYFVRTDKGPFLGRNALLKIRLEGPKQKLVGLEMVDRGVPREGYPVLVDGKPRGHVTTGMKSPTLNKFLALAYVPTEYSKIGTEVDVLIHGKPKKAVVVKTPFYVPVYRR